MAKRSRRSHTKRRKSRRGGAWNDPSTWFSSSAPTVGESLVPEATPVLDAAATAAPPPSSLTPPDVPPPAPGMNSLGGRRRRRRGGSRKTKRRGGKYY